MSRAVFGRGGVPEPEFRASLAGLAYYWVRVRRQTGARI